MQPYLLAPKERVRHWRDFRLSFSKDETDLDQLTKTVKYWHQFPTLNHFLDIDFPERWPTPWELIMGGDFCQACFAYLMEQTLLMSDDRWTEDRLQLMYVDDTTNSSMSMILVIDNKYVINYSYNVVNNFDIVIESCIIQHRYQVKNNLHFII